jgi:hypothetical protein
VVLYRRIGAILLSILVTAALLGPHGVSKAGVEISPAASGNASSLDTGANRVARPNAGADRRANTGADYRADARTGVTRNRREHITLR